MMYPAPRSARAFTLVELMVVVSIIVVLIAMLLPSLELAVDHAQRAKCLSNLRMLGVTTMSYCVDYQGSFPLRNAGASGFAGGMHSDNGTRWGVVWQNYLSGLDYDGVGKGHPILFCPTLANNGKTWRPSYAPEYRLSDYAYWPTLDVPWGTGNSGNPWMPDAEIPARKLGQSRNNQPLWNDALMEYRKGNFQWFIASHMATGRSRNGYIDNNTAATGIGAPAGGHQVEVHGGASWYKIADTQRALHMSWGADGDEAFQSWAFMR